MRFFSMDACLAMLDIAAAVLEDYEEAEGEEEGDSLWFLGERKFMDI